MGKAKSEPAIGDWRHLTLSVALILAVVGTLVLGAMLEASPDPPESASAAPAAARAVPEEPPEAGGSLDALAEPVPTGPALPYRGEADLVDRAAEDERRLEASGRGYTLQFAVVCDPRNVQAGLEALAGHPEFYVLTMLYRDRACFRLCWGFYDSEEQARAERDLPETLLRMTATPKVISVADALP